MRTTICLNRIPVKRLSASYRMKYQARRIRHPLVLKSRCYRLVSVQLWMVGQDEPAQEMCESVDAKPSLGENSDGTTILMTSLRRTSSRAGARTTPFS
jgi:hypothetical protein